MFAAAAFNVCKAGYKLELLAQLDLDLSLSQRKGQCLCAVLCSQC